MLYAVGGLGGTDAFFVILERKGCSAINGSKLSAVLPSKGVVQPVVIAQRIADGIVGNGCAVVLGELIAPACVTVGTLTSAGRVCAPPAVKTYYDSMSSLTSTG